MSALLLAKCIRFFKKSRNPSYIIDLKCCFGASHMVFFLLGIPFPDLSLTWLIYVLSVVVCRNPWFIYFRNAPWPEPYGLVSWTLEQNFSSYPPQWTLLNC